MTSAALCEERDRKRHGDGLQMRIFYEWGSADYLVVEDARADRGGGSHPLRTAGRGSAVCHAFVRRQNIRPRRLPEFPSGLHARVERAPVLPSLPPSPVAWPSSCWPSAAALYLHSWQVQTWCGVWEHAVDCCRTNRSVVGKVWFGAHV